MVTISGHTARVTFFRPGAEQVFLAGDFNQWRQGDLAMKRGLDGYWSALLSLPAGEFKFRYLADGEWFVDYAAFGLEPGPHGLDSLVRIADLPLRVALPAAPEETTAVAAA
jgi:1,4-alpha-glucan branching enzyme